MILYHGTNMGFDKIDLSQSRKGKDFGFGFYLTPDKSVATRQAERKYVNNQEGVPTVLSYQWCEDSVSDLNILRFDSYTLDWAEFILLNRKNKTNQQKHCYDIVIGPIADDTVGFQIRRLEDSIITMEQFLEEIKYHNVTFQYFFATEKALLTLQKI